MGKIKQGVLGGFSGKVGNVIGGSWKGIDYMRIQPSSVANPKTDLQVSMRSKFMLVVQFLQPLIAVLRVGFRNYAIRMSAFNSAVSHNYHNALQGSYPNYSIDFANVLVSRGKLTGALNPAIASGSAGTVTLSWEDNSADGNANLYDKTIAVVYNESKGEAVTLLGESERSATSQSVTVPDSWASDMVHGYVAFYTEEGALVSNSDYAGSVAVFG